MNRMAKVLGGIALPAAVAAGMLLFAARGDAGPDKIAYPANC